MKIYFNNLKQKYVHTFHTTKSKCVWYHSTPNSSGYNKTYHTHTPLFCDKQRRSFYSMQRRGIINKQISLYCILFQYTDLQENIYNVSLFTILSMCLLRRVTPIGFERSPSSDPARTFTWFFLSSGCFGVYSFKLPPATRASHVRHVLLSLFTPKVR